MATGEPRKQDTSVAGNAPATRTEAAVVDTTGIKVRMSDLENYLGSQAFYETGGWRRHPELSPRNLTQAEQDRISRKSARNGYGYSDRQVEKMAADYLNGDDHTRAIIIETLTDVNYHTIAAQLVQLGEDSEALQAIMNRNRNRRR